MNNSKIANNSIEEMPVDTTSLKEREAKLVRIIEALLRVSEAADWYTLKTEIFDGLVETLERRISAEAKKPEVVPSELYRLQGQLGWAKKYSNLENLAQVFKVELTNIRTKING